jgi:acyl-CoA synthetase (AMP-forming)/AMP-acid ligase II
MEPATTSHEPSSLGALIERQAIERGSAPYLLEARGSRVRSFVELRDEVAAFRAELDGWGLSPGDRIGLLLEDPLTFASWFLAGLSSGVWVAPLDPTLNPTNVRLFEDRARTLGLAAVVSDREAPENASISWRQVERVDAIPAALRAIDGSRVANGGVILSSSGTTGAPKVVPLSTPQLLETAALIARHNRLEPEDRGFNPLPLWHVNAEVVAVLATLVAGSSLVLEDSFHRTGFWKLIDDFEVTWINAVPAIISRLTAIQGDEVSLPRLRFVRSASAPLSPTLCERFETMTGVPVVESYGMTEAASQICANPIEGPRKSGSVGVPVGVHVRVVAPEHGSGGDAVVVGSIEIRGTTVISAYESQSYADRFDADGWLSTGDLGYFDDDGYLFIVGRSDDVINRGGEKIYPLEIENFLAALEEVAMVVVVGEADDVFGQVPVAYVQPRDTAVLLTPDAAAALVSTLRAQLGSAFVKAHRPASVRLVHHLPANGTGKVRKGAVRSGEVIVDYEEAV